MPSKTYLGHTVDVDADGYLVESTNWTREMGEAIAAELGVKLEPASWKVIDFARADFRETGQTPGLRRITARTGVDTKALYALFPKAPARTIAKIAGIPKPAGCL